MNRHAYFRQQEKNVLMHHGIKGQKWGVRRYQNEDGTLTEEGKRRKNRGKQTKISKAEKDNYLNFMNEMLVSPKMVDDWELAELTVMDYLDNKFGSNNYDNETFEEYMKLWENS